MIAAYKELKKLDPNDLVEPKLCITTKILNYKQALQTFYDSVPNSRTDGNNLVPDELTQWIVDDEARALVRDHAYGGAFAKVKHDFLHALCGTDRQTLAQSQTSFLELIISNAMNTLEKHDMTRATSKLIKILKHFEPHVGGYVSEVASPMTELIELLEGGTPALRLVEQMCSNKRANVFRAFFYHPNCKLAEHVVKELRVTLAASKETMASSREYTKFFETCALLSRDLETVLKTAPTLRINGVQGKRGIVGPMVQRTLVLKDTVKKTLAKLAAMLAPMTS